MLCEFSGTCQTHIASKQWLTSDRYWVKAESSVSGRPLVALYTSGTSMPTSTWEQEKETEREGEGGREG